MTVRRVTRAVVVGCAASALLVFAASAAAQSARGGLGGKIVDASGNPVPDAEVILENPEVNLRYVVKTNDKGEWAQGGMPVGNAFVAAPALPAGPAEDALSALVNLGYRRQEAQPAIGRVLERLGEAASLDQVIRDSLKELAR